MSLIQCSSLATASSSLAHSLPSSLSLSLLLFLTIYSNLSLSLSCRTTPPPCVLPQFCSYCALLLTYALLPSLPPFPPSLPVLLSLSAVSWAIFVTFLWLFPQGEQPLFSAPESCLWQFGRMMHFLCSASHLLIMQFCTLL